MLEQIAAPRQQRYPAAGASGYGAGMFRLGCAGWQLARSLQPRFPGPGTHLARYARVLSAVEINSSFHRAQRRQLYEKWAAEVPEGFRFAVKLPRWLTHEQRLRDTDGLDAFLGQVYGLGRKLGPLLIQLPPSLRFEGEHVERFLSALRQAHRGPVVCEPRHASWFAAGPERLLDRFEVARVAADPPVAAGCERPGGWPGCRYYRLHGQPRRFYSSYSTAFLDEFARRLRQHGAAAATDWCIFNNTAADAGLENALALRQRLRR